MDPLVCFLIAVLLNLTRPEAGTVHGFGLADGLVYHMMVTPTTLNRTPAWTDTSKEPPLSPLKAMLLADAKREKLVKDSGNWKWEFEKPALYQGPADRWYYEITYRCHFQGAVSTGPPMYLNLIVLMDGTVPDPVVWKRGNWMRAMEAGAFSPVGPTKRRPDRW